MNILVILVFFVVQMIIEQQIYSIIIIICTSRVVYAVLETSPLDPHYECSPSLAGPFVLRISKSNSCWPVPKTLLQCGKIIKKLHHYCTTFVAILYFGVFIALPTFVVSTYWMYFELLLWIVHNYVLTSLCIKCFSHIIHVHCHRIYHLCDIVYYIARLVVPSRVNVNDFAFTFPSSGMPKWNNSDDPDWERSPSKRFTSHSSKIPKPLNKDLLVCLQKHLDPLNLQGERVKMVSCLPMTAHSAKNQIPWRSKEKSIIQPSSNLTVMRQ